MTKITIILPVFNGEKTISKCLDHLIIQNYDKHLYEIFIIDDGSTDKTEVIAKEYSSRYDNIYYYHQNNAGPSSARNYGAIKAHYEYLAFIDADAYADKNWLNNISTAFKDSSLVACGGMVDNFNNSYLSNINHIVEFSEFYENSSKCVKTIPSVNLSVKKEVFEELGGFDENLSVGEDSDFNYRLHKLGYDLIYYPSIKVYHDTPNSFTHFLKKQYKFGLKSFEYRRKNPGSNYQFVFNKPLFLIAFPIYIIGNIYLYTKRKYFYKHVIKSILGLPIILIYRSAFWLGVGRYLFRRKN